MGLVAFWAAVLLAGVGVLWLALRRNDDMPRFVPNRRLLLVAGALMFGSLVFWWIGDALLSIGRTRPVSTLVDVLIVAGILVFAAGWILLGTGLRPRGSGKRGAMLAAVLYVLVGVGGGVLFTVGVGDARLADLLHNPGELALAAFAWPLLAAQAVGLIGLFPS